MDLIDISIKFTPNQITVEKLDQIIFYSLDKAIKSYRQMAQKNISKAGIDITIDQWLLLTCLRNNPDATQQQIATTVFKDYASITRMIELLVQREIIERNFHPDDRRRSSLTISPKGLQILADMEPLIFANRKTALEGISEQQIETARNMLETISRNCK